MKTAWKIPILLHKPHFKKLRGKIVINGPVSPAMIQLGFNSVSIYPNTGIIYENHGGTITFDGRCVIGGASAISIGPKGHLHLGAGVMASAALKLACYDHITIGANSLFGWENMLIDSDFHTLTFPDGKHSLGHGSISIGEECWLATGCLVLKGTLLPDRTTVQARTVLSGKQDIPPESVIGSELKITTKATGAYRDPADDKVRYD